MDTDNKCTVCGEKYENVFLSHTLCHIERNDEYDYLFAQADLWRAQCEIYGLSFNAMRAERSRIERYNRLLSDDSKHVD